MAARAPTVGHRLVRRAIGASISGLEVRFHDPMAALVCTSSASLLPSPVSAASAAARAGPSSDTRLSSRGFLSISPCSIQSTGLSRVLTASAAGTRALAVSAKTSDSELIKALKDEIKYEKENYEPLEGIDKVPEGFSVESISGAAEFVLRKSFQAEDIALVVAPPEEEPEDDVFDEDEEEEGGQQEQEDEEEGLDDFRYIPVKLSITKKANDGLLQTLEFDLGIEGEGSEWVIEAVKSKSANVPEGSIAYFGPDYFTLDPALQEQFTAYIRRRGITSELGAYIRDYVDEKDQKEYEGWLHRVKDFISA